MRRRSGESKEARPLLLSRLRFSIRPGFAPVPTPLEARRAHSIASKDIIMAAIKQLAAVTRSGTGRGPPAPFVAKAAFPPSSMAAA